MSEVEHVNITVRDAKATAQTLCDLFDWKIRWQGTSMNGEGYSVHVGSSQSYVALYTPNDGANREVNTGNFNHLGILVDDIEGVEIKVKAAGYKTTNHADYDPGRRFYFFDEDNIEFEVISYS